MIDKISIARYFVNAMTQMNLMNSIALTNRSRGMLRDPMATAAVLLMALVGSLPATAEAFSPSATQCAPISSGAPKLAAARFEEGPTISQADLVADFDAWLSGMRALNPDISIRAEVRSMDEEAARIRRTLSGPMKRRQA